MSGTLRLDFDDRWVQVDLDNIDEWAVTAAEAAWERVGRRPRRRLVRPLQGALLSAAEKMLSSEVVLGFMLIPEPYTGMTAAVMLRTFPAPAGMTLRDLAEDVIGPAENQHGTPTVTYFSTSAGDAVRILQRYDEPLNPATERVSEHLMYAWLLPEHELIVTVTSGFPDLQQADIWREDVDELAQTFTVEP